MLRIFDHSQKKETNVSTKLSYDITVIDGIVSGKWNTLKLDSSGTFKSCYNKEDFERVFKEITEELETMESTTSKTANVKIKLNGKLNGNDLEVEFNDLNSYKEFLVENELIPVQKLKLGNNSL